MAGTITRRADGSWRARITYGAGAGRRESSKVFPKDTPGGPKKAAERWQAAQSVRLGVAGSVDSRLGRPTLAEYYVEFAALRTRWATGTRRAADTAIAGCTFKDIPLGALTEAHVAAWIRELSTTLRPSTIRTRVAYVKMVMRRARAKGHLAVDLLADIDLPAARRQEFAMRIPTGAEIAAIREHAEPFLRPMLDVMAFAGLRIGEAAAVQVGDVADGRLHVARQIQNHAGVREVCAPKHGSERRVPVPEALVQRLEAHVAEHGAQAGGWLLPGQPPSPAALRKWFNIARDAAGVDASITPHDFRHYFASGLIRAGLDVTTVSKALGHGDPAITLRVYAHLFPDAADRTRDAIAGLMAD